MIDWNIDRSWTLFLDRDGVINERIMSGYVTCINDFVFLPDVPEAISRFSTVFGHVFVVTNQQGIAKGLMSESNLQEIHDYMQDKVREAGGQIRKSYYAPGAASSKNSLRKPNPGMALLAQRQFEGVDFKKSIMVGDTDSDIVFGQNLGMKTVRVASVEPIKVPADLTVSNLMELANLIIK